MSSTENVKLGVCKITFGGVDLGYTQGGVEVTVSTDTHKVEVDQFGKTAISEQIQGRSVKVKAPLAETTLENLVATMPGATLVDGGAGADSVTVTTGVGLDLLTLSKELRLHPIANLDADVSEDFVVYKAATPGALTFAYKIDAERIFNVEFTGYPDPITRLLFGVGVAI